VESARERTLVAEVECGSAAGSGYGLTWQSGEGALDLLPDPAECDAEDALAALEHVDDLVRRPCQRHIAARQAPGHERSSPGDRRA
jgi:hypothetical protein